MTEPDWNQSPSWAQWFAVDSDGEAWWYETQPDANTKHGAWQQEFYQNIYLLTELAGNYPELAADWQNSLRQRP